MLRWLSVQNLHVTNNACHKNKSEHFNPYWHWWQIRPQTFGTFSTAEGSPSFHVRWYAVPVKLYTDDGGIRPAGVLMVVKLHECAPTNTLCQPPGVQANKLFLIIAAFPKGEHLQTKCAQYHLNNIHESTVFNNVLPDGQNSNICKLIFSIKCISSHKLVITFTNGARSEGSRRTSGVDEISRASLASEKSNGTPPAGGYRG